MKKKQILIVYNIMGIGGSTTSLLSLLNNMDCNKYDIDFALATNTGELFELIPSGLTLLEELCPSNITQMKRRSVVSIVKYVHAKILSMCSKNPRNVMGQLMTYENARFSRCIEKEYDVAISFIENYPLNYVATKVSAKKKITWIHVDYKAAGFIPKYDQGYYEQFDKLVLVSDECKRSFDECFPSLADRSIVVENILSSYMIRKMADKAPAFGVDDNKCNIITVCRITFSHKGIDRGVNAFKRLKDEKISHNFHWYIVGDGIDFNKLKQMINDYGLTDMITLLGSKNNPLPYEKNMDLFLLPSRYEGKPMAVTEAQMLGIPPVVTAYASASSQVNSGFDGYVVPNEDNAIYDALKYIAENIDQIQVWKNNLSRENFDNMQDVEKIYRLIEE